MPMFLPRQNASHFSAYFQQILLNRFYQKQKDYCRRAIEIWRLCKMLTNRLACIKTPPSVEMHRAGIGLLVIQSIQCQCAMGSFEI